MAERFRFDVDGQKLTALVHSAVKPIGSTLLLGHGASAGQRDRFIADYAAGLAERGVLAVTFDFPFIEHGRRSPDRDEVLVESYRAAVVAARQCRPKNHLFIGGKSLGGRIACEVAAAGGEEVDDLAGVVLLGYPLHPIGKPSLSRSHHLLELPVPALIVQGTRDVFGMPEELRPVMASLPKGSELHVVEGGDHSFVVPTRSGLSHEQVEAEIEDEVVRWMTEIVESPRAAARGPSRARPIAARRRAQLRTLRRSASR